MDRQTLLKFVFPFLLVTAGVVWYRNLSGDTAPRRSAGQTADVPRRAQVRKLITDYQELQVRVPTAEAVDEWGRDPFQRLAAETVRHPPDAVPEQQPVPDFHLDAVMVDPGQAIAIINGEEVLLNGRVQGFSVTEISPDRVLLNDGKRTVELRL